MRIRRYQAPDMRQALRLVRDELGSDAVILSNERVAEGIEITAATDTEAASNEHQSTSARPGLAAEPRAVPALHDGEPTLAAVSEELRMLRGLLEQQLSSLAWRDLEDRDPTRAGILRRLLDIGLARDLCEQVVATVPTGSEPVQAWRAALADLRGRVSVTSDDLLSDGGVVALLGPTGVGKTTTIAKLAARFALRHGPEQVALLTTDSFRIGAFEQLRTFARIMGIPVTVVNDEGELRRAVDRHYDRRLVLVDTAGMSQRDRRFSEQIRLVGRGSPLVRNYLVISATCQQRSVEEALDAFAGARPDACVITKLDESVSLGAALSVLASRAIPAAYVSDGQRVPEDLQVASPGALVSRALALAHARGGRRGASLEGMYADAS